MPLGEGRELSLGQLEHDRVAQRRNGGGADAVCEEADLSDGRSAPHLGDAATVDIDGEATRGDEIERISRIALAHENLAAGDGLGDEQPLELGKMHSRQVAEGFDQRQRGCPGGISCLRRLSVAQRQALAYRLVAFGENSAEASLTVSEGRNAKRAAVPGHPLQILSNPGNHRAIAGPAQTSPRRGPS
jgi:hypothetical protein